jgi:hypothetical protein
VANSVTSFATEISGTLRKRIMREKVAVVLTVVPQPDVLMMMASMPPPAFP